MKDFKAIKHLKNQILIMYTSIDIHMSLLITHLMSIRKDKCMLYNVC